MFIWIFIITYMCFATQAVCVSAEIYTIEVPVLVSSSTEKDSEEREFYTTEEDSEDSGVYTAKEESEDREFYTTEDDSSEEGKEKEEKGKEGAVKKKEEKGAEPVEMGWLFVPDLKIEETLYYADVHVNPERTQEICDRPDCAIWMDFSGKYGKNCQQIIGDHINQGFATLSNVVPGETLAFVFHDHTVDAYICRLVKTGHNCEEDSLQTEDGTPVALENRGGLCMYTCNGRWQDVILTYWERYQAP